MSIITNQQIYDALKTQADAVSGNKMRTTDADVLAKLQAIEQRLNDPFLTQLTGRNVEKTSIFNGLAITDTTNKVSSTIDLTKYKQVTFIVINSLDQEVELIFQEVIGTFYGYYNPSTSAWVATNNNPIKVPSSGQRRNILNTVPVPLFDRPLERVTVIARCTTAPTTGALTVYVLGVPN